MNKLLMTASTYSHIRSFHLPYLWKFQQLGWETHIGSSGIPDELPACVDRAIALPFEKKMTAPANFQAARILRDRIKSERYDLIVTHTALAAFFTRLAVKGLKNRPQIVNVVHGYLFDDETPFLKRSVLLTAEHFTAPETDLLLTMNDWDDHAAKRYRLGKQIEKIPGIGVDFSRLDAATAADGAALRDTLGIPAGAFVLIYPAEFSARKSQLVLIEAMALLPERTVLVLPGSGALLEQCKARAQQLGLRTCWAALTFNRKAVRRLVPDGDELIIVIAMGYGADNGTEHRSQTEEKLAARSADDPAWYLQGVRAALSAPTAVNQQKFRIARSGRTVSIRTAGLGPCLKIDLGIVKCHFEIGAGKENFQWA